MLLKKPKPNYIRVYSDHGLWYNENLWNLGISNTSKSPSDAEPRWQYSWLFHVYRTNPLPPRKETPRCASRSFPNKELFWQMFYVLTCFPKKKLHSLESFLTGVATSPGWNFCEPMHGCVRKAFDLGHWKSQGKDNSLLTFYSLVFHNS